jgi:hypothetical protein
MADKLHLYQWTIHAKFGLAVLQKKISIGEKKPVADGYQVMEIAYIAYDQASLKLT